MGIQSFELRRGPQQRSLGFAPCESGLLWVVDPLMLGPYMKNGIIEEWIAACLASLGEGSHEVALGTDGGQAVAIYGTQRGRHVLATESLEGGREITINQHVRDAQ